MFFCFFDDGEQSHAKNAVVGGSFALDLTESSCDSHAEPNVGISHISTGGVQVTDMNYGVSSPSERYSSNSNF